MKASILLLLRQAMDLPRTERPTFVAQATVDPSDRAVVLDLLESLSDATLTKLSDPNAATPMLTKRAGEAGTRIGPFTLLAPLGTGGMGTVWLAERQEKFVQRVAIKWLYGSTSEQARARFAREREVLARLEHPAIARIVDGGEDQGVPWYAMEFVDGETLLSYAQSERLDLQARLNLFLQLADAVQFAHQRFIVHRDLKPSNVLVSRQGALKLLDFGIAKLLDGSEHLTEAQSPMTLAYAAPEQIRGEAITAATDVYGLGLLLYELLTGQRPYRASNSAEMLQRITDTDVPLPSRQTSSDDTPNYIDRRQLRGDLDVIVLKALHREPTRRYESARAMADDLRRYLAHQPIQARTDSWFYRSSKFLRRHTIASALVGVLAVSLLGSAAWAFRKQQEALASAQSARASNEFLLTRLSSASPWQDGANWTVRDLLKDTAQQVGKALSDQPEARINLYRTIRDALSVDRPSVDALYPAERLVEELHTRGDFQGESEALYELLRVQMHQIQRLDLAEPTLLELESRLPKLDPGLARNVRRGRGYFENYRGNLIGAERAFMQLLPDKLLNNYEFDAADVAFNQAQDAAAVGELIDLRRQQGDLRSVIELLQLLEWHARVGTAAQLPRRVQVMQSLVGLVSDLLSPEQALALADRWAEFGSRQFGANSAMHEHLASQRLFPMVRTGQFAEAEQIIRGYIETGGAYPEESQLSLQRSYLSLALIALNEDRGDKVLAALDELDQHLQRVPPALRVSVVNPEVDWFRAWAKSRLGEPGSDVALRAQMVKARQLGAAYLANFGNYELARRAWQEGRADDARALVNEVDPDGSFLVVNPVRTAIELRQALKLSQPTQYRAEIDALHLSTLQIIDSMLEQATKAEKSGPS